MTVRDLTDDERRGLRDASEERLAVAVNLAVRDFLRQVMVATGTRTSLTAASAATAPEPENSADLLTYGAVAGWWASSVDTEIADAVRMEWMQAYQETRFGVVTQTSLDAGSEFLTVVRDRLVQGLEPPLPEDAFNVVRVNVARAGALGWSSRDLSARLAAELGWEKNGPYWREQLAATDARIDSILDALGEPGTVAREQARLDDPIVRQLQADRATLVQRLDAEASHWQVRASRIARTEATAAHAYGTLSALFDEGAPRKRWLATNDPRTRAAHRHADDQVVPIGGSFIVGGVAMFLPGDPSAPASLTVNCRCDVVGDWDEDDDGAPVPVAEVVPIRP